MTQQIIDSKALMLDFAHESGLSKASRKPRRYLWTDAFAVCNFLGLYGQTGEQQYLQLALDLVDQVHQVLGKYHQLSNRNGWISGLDDQQARLHPTRGGLRIGKKLDERQTSESYDEQLEWDRDGQYYHYLTKWMHALNRVSQVTNDSKYNQWALELAKVAHAAFTYTTPNGNIRMVWKMRIDLSDPLVDSMGYHDPLDGLITYEQLQATSKQFSDTPIELSLIDEIEDMVKLCQGRNWATQDSLGLGGLLSDACRLTQLITSQHVNEHVRLELLLNDIDISLKAFVQQNQLNLPAEYRLAFRELGLSIGLQGIERMQKLVKQHAGDFSNLSQLSHDLIELAAYKPISDTINNFWLQPTHRNVDAWVDHADINNVMLATSLVPDGYL